MRLLVIAMLAAIFCGCATKPLVIADASSYASQGSAYKGLATVYVARGMGRVGVVTITGPGSLISLSEVNLTSFSRDPV